MFTHGLTKAHFKGDRAFQVEFEFRKLMLVFVKGRKPENLEKTLRASRDNNQQQTHDQGPTYMYNVESGYQTLATMVGGKCY